MTTDLQILPFFRKWLIFPGKYILLKQVFSVNIISFHQELRGIFVIKTVVEMQNNLPSCG
jgi:hypothetical protein